MKSMKIQVLAAVLVSLLLSLTAYAVSDKELMAIEARITPVGEVCLEGDNSCGVVAAVASAGPRSGEDVYNAACMACHSTGAAGAPKVGDAAAWGDRIAKGIDVLYGSGLNGLSGTGMMAKGGCMNCSDDEVKSAIDFMVGKSQ
jgi:cytochrome c5